MARHWWLCNHCCRAYQGQEEGDCPYCGSWTMKEGFRWSNIQKTAPELPKTPKEGEVYNVWGSD